MRTKFTDRIWRKQTIVAGRYGGRENAFQAVSVVSTNLDASNVKTANNIDQANNTFERRVDIDTSRTEKHNNTYEAKTVNDTRDITRRDSETVEDNKFTHDSSTNIVTSVKEDHSNSYSSGTKVSVGDTVNDYTGGLAMLKGGLSNFGANQGLMKEAFVDNMTKYQDSILKRDGTDGVSEKQTLDAMARFNAQVGIGAFGSGTDLAFNAAVKASVGHSSGQVDTANLNRLMNENIMNQLNVDAKANNWTAEQYDAAARERFGAYNNYLHEQAGGQAYGPGNMNSEILAAGKELVNQTGELVVDATNTAKSGIDTVKKVF